MPLSALRSSGEKGEAQASLFFARFPGIAAACVILLAAAPFALALGGGFLFDDYPNLVRNPAFAQPPATLADWWSAIVSSGASFLGRPLAMFTFAVDAALWGLDPLPFKCVNLGIHALNGLLLWACLSRLLRAPACAAALERAGVDRSLAAIAIAAAWTMLPIHLSAVMLVVQRMELLAQTFVLLGMSCYLEGRLRQIEGRPGGGLRVLAGLFLFPALGLLAKESALLLPAYALALELWLLRFAAADARIRARLRLGYGAFALLAAAAGAWILSRYLQPAEWAHRDFTVGERLLTQARLLWEYLRWIFVPDPRLLALHHDDVMISRSLLDPPTTLIALVAWASVLAWLLHCLRAPSLAALGAAWYLLGHALTAGPLPLELAFEHRNYAASVGALLCLCALLLALSERAAQRSLLGALVIVIGLAWMAAATLRAADWGDPLRRTAADARNHPDSPRSLFEFGRELWLRAQDQPSDPRFALAMDAWRRAAERSTNPAPALQAIVAAQGRAGVPVAQTDWQGLRAAWSRPDVGPEGFAGLAALVRCQLAQECRLPDPELLKLLLTALAHYPKDTSVLVHYGLFAQQRLGDASLGLSLLREAVEVQPGNSLNWYELAVAAAVAGQLDEARRAIDGMRQADRWHRYSRQLADAQKLLDHLQQAPPPAR